MTDRKANWGKSHQKVLRWKRTIWLFVKFNNSHQTFFTCILYSVKHGRLRFCLCFYFPHQTLSFSTWRMMFFMQAEGQQVHSGLWIGRLKSPQPSDFRRPSGESCPGNIIIYLPILNNLFANSFMFLLLNLDLFLQYGSKYFIMSFVHIQLF